MENARVSGDSLVIGGKQGGAWTSLIAAAVLAVFFWAIGGGVTALLVCVVPMAMFCAPFLIGGARMKLTVTGEEIVFRPAFEKERRYRLEDIGEVETKRVVSRQGPFWSITLVMRDGYSIKFHIRCNLALYCKVPLVEKWLKIKLSDIIREEVKIGPKPNSGYYTLKVRWPALLGAGISFLLITVFCWTMVVGAAGIPFEKGALSCGLVNALFLAAMLLYGAISRKIAVTPDTITISSFSKETWARETRTVRFNEISQVKEETSGGISVYAGGEKIFVLGIMTGLYNSQILLAYLYELGKL